MSKRHDTINKVFTASGNQTYDVRGYSDAFVVLTEDGEWAGTVEGAVTESGTFIGLYEKYSVTAIGSVTANDAAQVDLRGVGYLKLTATETSGASLTFDIGLYEE